MYCMQIKSVQMAVQLAMHKLQLKRCGRSVNVDRLVDAFKWVVVGDGREKDLVGGSPTVLPMLLPVVMQSKSESMP